jgi:hypothetical protein
LAAGVDEQPDNATAIDTEQYATTSLIGLPVFLFTWCNLGGECGIFAVFLSLQLYVSVLLLFRVQSWLFRNLGDAGGKTMWDAHITGTPC